MLKVRNANFGIDVIGTKNPYPVLELGCGLLNQCGCEYWLSYGTALGLYRDGKIFESDTDIDVNVVSNKEVYEIFKLFKHHFRLIRVTKFNGFICQCAWMHESGIIFDIEFLRVVADNMWSCAEALGEITIPSSFRLTREYRTFEITGDVLYPMLEPRLLLPWIYGQDYMTPKPKNETVYYFK